jgi:hypothetical protein
MVNYLAKRWGWLNLCCLSAPRINAHQLVKLIVGLLVLRCLLLTGGLS